MDKFLSISAGYLCFQLLSGYWITKITSVRTARLLAWIHALTAVLAGHWLTLECSPFVRMTVIIVFLFVAMKIVVCSDYYPGRSKLGPIQWGCFALAWPGMRPSLFEEIPFRPVTGGGRLAFQGFLAMIIGCGLLWLASTVSGTGSGSYWIKFILSLTGLSLMFHFGLLRIIAGCWRFAGLNVKQLFNKPFRAETLGEFWNSRWNIAFTEMTALSIYRPIRKMQDKPAGIVGAFLASGIFHEIAISLPVMKGFGLPLIYFAIQGVMVIIQERAIKNSKWFFKT
ncbi:membrane bound O-acyltransferase family protein [Anseongella ginsenosidimutans]|uniref:Membrane bound O-acyltransferase family protein n=1 Tax=Anseongella ginsenosidimutans TaxID=496056 RepID=A0A4R3KU96_9SPHI|nr:MBOAT family protein [Anseongella ginsenosidimutans]QEC51624.1 hypothetical protein FRZ59_04175 [Anseongella ginsenosidimutans]TCS88957.1 membrane bound O-acyltransferase family protein [Anseongella ginsenosidimutans]